MNRNLIIGAVILLAALGIWQKDALREAWEDRSGVAEQDDELDRELEGIGDELEGAESEGSSEFEELETKE